MAKMKCSSLCPMQVEEQTLPQDFKWYIIGYIKPAPQVRDCRIQKKLNSLSLFLDGPVKPSSR